MSLCTLYEYSKEKIVYRTTFEEISGDSQGLLAYVNTEDNLDVNPISIKIIRRTRGVPLSKIGLIAICLNVDASCYLFNVYQLKELPPPLKQLLTHGNVKLVSNTTNFDFSNFRRTFFGNDSKLNHLFLHECLNDKYGITDITRSLKILAETIVNRTIETPAEDYFLDEWDDDISFENLKMFIAIHTVMQLQIYNTELDTNNANALNCYF